MNRRNQPLPFGVMTLTSSSTVALFLPFFLANSLSKKQQIFFRAINSLIKPIRESRDHDRTRVGKEKEDSIIV